MRKVFHPFRVLKSVFLGLIAAFVIFLISNGITALADVVTLPVEETGLNGSGSAWEVNPAADGTVWVSDKLHGEIRSYATDGSQVTIYSGLSEIKDARMDVTGTVWFVAQTGTNYFGQLNPGTGAVKLWYPPDGTNAFGTAIDDQGSIWISDNLHPRISRFDPDPVSPQMCVLDYASVSSDGTSEYIIFDGQYIWFADTVNFKIMRYDVSTNDLQPYSTNEWDFYAEGLVSDGAGGIWFTDYTTGDLGHLDLSGLEAALYQYQLPAGTDLSAMLTMQEGIIWYTAYDADSESIGRMDPSIVPLPVELRLSNNQSDTLGFSCVPATSWTPNAAIMSTDTPTWTQNSIDEVPLLPNGWTVYSFNNTVDQGGMFGITYHDGSIWAVDNENHKLIRHIINPIQPAGYSVYLPLIIR